MEIRSASGSFSGELFRLRCIHVPADVLGVLFGQDGDLEHELLCEPGFRACMM